jgi:beta-lactamase regulating signal transducer with metallopeptidase domain
MPAVSVAIVIDLVAKTSLILAVTAIAAAALRRASASARHLVWTLGLVGALAAPALSVVTPRWELPLVNVPQATEAAGQQHNEQTAERSGFVQGERNNTSASVGQLSGVPSLRVNPVPFAPPARSALAPSSPSPAMVVLTIWVIGAVFVLARMLLGLIAVQWMSRRTAVVHDAPWLEQARALAASLGLGNVRFLRARTQTMPMAWGVLRASVLMPQDADAWPADRLRIVLLHELAHVKRRDCLTHLLAQVAIAAYWFNPLAWIAVRHLRTERERACDDLVLASGTRGSDYADQLLDIARTMRSDRFPGVLAGATLAMAHRSQLEGRLIAILDPNVPRRALTRARLFAGAAVFALIVVPVAAVQPWTTAAAELKGPINPHQAVPPVGVSGGVAGGVSGGVARGVNNGVTAGVTGGIEGGAQAGVEGGVAVSQAIRDGVTRGVTEGVQKGIGVGVGTGVGIGVDVATGVTHTVVASVVNDMANGIAGAVSRELAGHDPNQKAGGKPDQEAGRKPDPRAVDALAAALKDTDEDVRETAMKALIQFRDPRVFEPLIAALRDKSADVREEAAFGLGQLRDPRAVQPLAGALKDESDDVREQAAFALGQIRDAKAVDALSAALKDKKEDVREQAAFALGQLRDAKAVDALVAALKDSVEDVREQAAFALGQIRDPRAIDGLTAALKDASASVREQAAFALGQIR